MDVLRRPAEPSVDVDVLRRPAKPSFDVLRRPLIPSEDVVLCRPAILRSRSSTTEVPPLARLPLALGSRRWPPLPPAAVSSPSVLWAGCPAAAAVAIMVPLALMRRLARSIVPLRVLPVLQLGVPMLLSQSWPVALALLGRPGRVRALGARGARMLPPLTPPMPPDMEVLKLLRHMSLPWLVLSSWLSPSSSSTVSELTASA